MFRQILCHQWIRWEVNSLRQPTYWQAALLVFSSVTNAVVREEPSYKLFPVTGDPTSQRVSTAQPAALCTGPCSFTFSHSQAGIYTCTLPQQPSLPRGGNPACPSEKGLWRSRVLCSGCRAQRQPVWHSRCDSPSSESTDVLGSPPLLSPCASALLYGERRHLVDPINL